VAFGDDPQIYLTEEMVKAPYGAGKLTGILPTGIGGKSKLLWTGC